MWKYFGFGLIVGVIGSAFIFMKLVQKHLVGGVVVIGDSICQRMIVEGVGSLEKYTLSDDELEMMLLLTNSSTPSQIGSNSARWN